ncbi:hypothetical protein BO78DRAFT_292293, partial [Aspergillus sclerotiicarbonarius CBS 121057]
SSLDGLRGYAALAVMNYHILYAYQNIVFYGYGLSQEAVASSCGRPGESHATTNWIIQLPILRLPITGTWPISVFYVLSGFALSYKPLKESREPLQGFAKSTAAVASSCLRRPIRLFGPPVLATFITMLGLQLGAFNSSQAISKSSDWVSIINEALVAPLSSFSAQLADWVYQTWRMLFVFWWGDIHNHYDVHLWTIPAEFRSSLAIFLFLPMYITVKPWVRRPLTVLSIIYIYALDRWDVALFYSGLLIADTSIDWMQTHDETTNRKFSERIVVRVLRIVLLGLSLHLLSGPDFCASQTPGFRTLSLLVPSSDPAPFRFLPNLGGIILISLITHTAPSNPVVSTVLNGFIPQYLGRISYSLYIVHGPLTHMIGYHLFKALWTVTGVEQVWRYVVGFLAAYVVLVTIIICIADMFWRGIDKTFVQVARKFENLITI